VIVEAQIDPIVAALRGPQAWISEPSEDLTELQAARQGALAALDEGRKRVGDGGAQLWLIVCDQALTQLSQRLESLGIAELEEGLECFAWTCHEFS
jgi:hypothetical protein